jgi:hypothetical protein
MNPYPPSLELLVCPVCGRTDRYASLKEGVGRHFSHGKRCEGAPIRVLYDVAHPASESKEEHEGSP